jgi:hypothetical protein
MHRLAMAKSHISQKLSDTVLRGYYNKYLQPRDIVTIIVSISGWEI